MIGWVVTIVGSVALALVVIGVATFAAERWPHGLDWLNAYADWWARLGRRR